MSSLNQGSHKFDEIIKRSVLTEEGRYPARYNLKTSAVNLDQSKPYRKMTCGERDKNKPHKTILMVGETGTGKTTLINVMINYMLGVQREDKVWFEITDDQSDRTSVYSQTTCVTVYGFYPQESPIHLTIIDTPGYGNTRGADLDKEISNGLLSLSQSEEEIQEIDAVCLVIDASLTRLSDRQRYIFDAVQSLFGRDITENIVLLLTHSSGPQPKNALTAVKEAKIKCAVNDKNQPVYFLFNNRQSEPAEDEEYEINKEYEKMQAQLWDQSFKRIEEFFKFLDTIKPKTMRKSQEVWYQHELKAYISSLQQCDQRIKQKQEALKQDEGYVKNNVENAQTDGTYPKKENIHEDPKKEYDDKIGNSVALNKKLVEELHELEREKIKHAFDAFRCVDVLRMITHNIDSYPNIDFLTEKLKELKEPKKVEKLESIKQEAEKEKTMSTGIQLDK